MANHYYRRQHQYLPRTPARGEEIKDDLTSIEMGFDRLPPHNGQSTGFDQTFVVAESTQDFSPVPLKDAKKWKHNVDANNHRLCNLPDPVNSQDAVNKQHLERYVDDTTYDQEYINELENRLDSLIVEGVNGVPVWSLSTEGQTQWRPETLSFDVASLYLDGQAQRPAEDYLIRDNTLLFTQPLPAGVVMLAYVGSQVLPQIQYSGGQIYYKTVSQAWLGENEGFDRVVIGDRANAPFEKISEAVAETYPDIVKFRDTSGQWWGVCVKGVVNVSWLIDDPMDRDQVNQAAEYIGLIVADQMVIDFNGLEYVWPTVSFSSNQKRSVMFHNGAFIRKDNIGAEYLIWITESDGCVIQNLYIDGGVAQLPQWGQQGLYVRKSTNTKIINNYLCNIGDGAIRYAHNTTITPEITLTTRGLIVSGNTFEHCQQITSNGTGASEVVFGNNVFINAGIKITQRTALLDEGSTLITGNSFLMDDTRLGYAYNQNCISVQGGKNIHIENNSFIQKTNATIFESYVNSGSSSGYPFGGIPSINIYIRNNNIRTFGNVKLFAILGHYDANKGEHYAPLDSEIIVSGNTISIENDITGDGIFRSDSYGSGGSGRVAGHYLIDNNMIIGKGRAKCLFQTSTNSGIWIGDGNVLTLSNNQGAFIEGLCSGVFKLHPGGHLKISGNVAYSPTLTSNFSSVMNSKDCVFEVINNTHYITDLQEGATTWQSSVNNNNLYADTQIYSGNTFIRTAKKGITPRYVFWLWPIHTSMTIPTSFVFTDNRILLKGEYNCEDAYVTRPLYVNSAGSRQSPTKLLAANNWYSADADARSDSSDVLGVEHLLILNSETTPPLYKVSAGWSRPDFDASGKSWIKYEQYSDGRYREWGYQYKEYEVPQSGQTYFRTHAPHTNYHLTITPDHTEPVAFAIKSRGTNSFVTQMSLANSANEIRPYFFYQAEWNINDSFG